MEWNGDPLWWSDGVQLQQEHVSAPLAALVSAPAATSCEPRPTVRAPAKPAAAPQVQQAAPNAAIDQAIKPADTPKKQSVVPCRQSMTDPPAKRQPWFEFLPLQTSVKPTLRPKLPCSKKNQGSVDKQAAREQQAAEGRAARYMQQAATLACHNHHHALQLGHAGATPEEHIVLGDKGKHRPAASRSDFIFDPITSTSRPVTAPGRTASRSGLLSPYKGSTLSSTADQDVGSDSTSGQRDSSSDGSRGHETLFFAGSLYHTFNGELMSLQRRPGSSGQGRYNPLTHTWAEQPKDAAVYERWQREGDAALGSSHGRRPSTADTNGSRGAAGKSTVGSLLRQQSVGSSGGDILQLAGTGRKAVRSGDTWGTYDVLRNEWVVPPADARYVNREMGPGSIRAEPLISTNNGSPKPMRKAVTPPSTGVYDPIRAEWKVLPQRLSAAYTLDFAPRKLFEQKAFVKRSK